MILLDAVYIHNSGGRTLLLTLLNVLSKKDINNYWVLLDNRLDKKFIKSFKIKNKAFINASEFHRRRFYIRNHKRFKSIFCFANVPPPISINKRVIVYFQNELLLNRKNTQLGKKAQLILALKKKYISFLNKKSYLWAVQTNRMKEKLIESLGVQSNNVEIYPFFEELNKSHKIKFEKNTFIYVAGQGAHKNHKRLLVGFNEAAKESKVPLTVRLTLPESDFSSLLNSLDIISPNLRIENLGVLKKEQLLKSYQESQYCIYPSLKESFGLPLIEAAQLESLIIASNLPFVSEVIKPSLTFDPYSEKDIALIILKAVNLNVTEKTVLKVTNKIENLISYISNDV